VVVWSGDTTNRKMAIKQCPDAVWWCPVLTSQTQKTIKMMHRYCMQSAAVVLVVLTFIQSLFCP